MKDINSLSKYSIQELEQADVSLSEQFEALCEDWASVQEWSDMIAKMKSFELPQGSAIQFNVTGDFVTLDSEETVRAFFSALSKENFVGIGFDQMDFSDGIWRVILEEIQKNKKIVYLGIEGSVFADTCNPKEDKRLIQNLQSQLECLVLNDLSISEADAKFFKALFEGNKILNSVMLTSLTTTEECEGLLAAGLHSCINLKNLDLSGSQFSPRMSTITAEVLAQLPHLQFLALNRMPNNNGLANWAPITTSSSLRCLFIKDNKNLDDNLILEIFQNSSLTNLALQNSTYSDDNLFVGLTCYQTREEKLDIQIVVDAASPCIQNPSFKEFFTNQSGIRMINAGTSHFDEEGFSPMEIVFSCEQEVKLQQANEKLKAEHNMREMLCIQQRDLEIARSLLVRVSEAKVLTPQLNSEIKAYKSAFPEMTFAVKEKAFNLILQKHRLVKVSVPKDGNCLFHSILLLNEFPQEQGFDAPSLRRHLVGLMRARADDFVVFVGGEDFDGMEIDDQDEKWDVYCDLMLDKDMFPGPVELGIMSEFLNREIQIFDPEYGFIFDERGSLRLADGMSYGKSTLGVEPIRLYRSFNHFDPLILN